MVFMAKIGPLFGVSQLMSLLMFSDLILWISNTISIFIISILLMKINGKSNPVVAVQLKEE
jgi:hypothetical protein